MQTKNLSGFSYQILLITQVVKLFNKIMKILKAIQYYEISTVINISTNK